MQVLQASRVSWVALVAALLTAACFVSTKRYPVGDGTEQKPDGGSVNHRDVEGDAADDDDEPAGNDAAPSEDDDALPGDDDEPTGDDDTPSRDDDTPSGDDDTPSGDDGDDDALPGDDNEPAEDDDTPPESDDDNPPEPPEMPDRSLGLVVGDTVTLEQLPAALARAICNRFYACCSEERLREDGSDVDACTWTWTFLILRPFYIQPLIASQEQGRARYHGDFAAECLRAVDAVGCDTPPLELCADAIEPLLATGEPCALDLECIDGACLVDQCGAPQPQNSPCADNADCESSYCAPQTSTCQPLAGADEPCTDNAECASNNCVSLRCGEPVAAACL